MKAWRLSAAGGQLALKDVPEPKVRSQSALVRVEATPMLSYLGSFVAGELTTYHPPSGEFTPGTNAVGTIMSVGDGVLGLEPGQRVFAQPYLQLTENVPEPAESLIGLTAEPASAELMDAWPDGTLAELVLAPVSTLTPIPAGLEQVSSAELAKLARCVVPYGGLLRGRLSAGETVVIHGATGAFGSAAVLVALALGAGTVVAAGRNVAALERLSRLARVVTVQISGDVAADTVVLRERAGQAPDCALDMIGRASSADGTLATLASLRRGGRMVLMGSMTVPLPIDYAALLRSGKELLGNFMYPPWAPARLLGLVRAGLLDLSAIPSTTYTLDDVEAAMTRAAEPGAPLIVIT